MSVSRRKFLGLFGAAVATPYIPPIKEEVGEIFELTYQENGMFQYYSGYPLFSDMVRHTVNHYKTGFADNVASNNALLRRFQNGQAEKAKD